MPLPILSFLFLPALLLFLPRGFLCRPIPNSVPFGPSTPITICLGPTDPPRILTATFLNVSSPFPLAASVACLAGPSCADVSASLHCNSGTNNNRNKHNNNNNNNGCTEKEVFDADLGAAGRVDVWEVTSSSSSISVSLDIRYASTTTSSKIGSGGVKCVTVLVWDAGSSSTSSSIPINVVGSTTDSNGGFLYGMSIEKTSGAIVDADAEEEESFDVSVEPGNRLTFAAVVGSVGEVRRCDFVGKHCVLVWREWEYQDSEMLMCQEGVNRCRYKLVQKEKKGILTVVFVGVFPATGFLGGESEKDGAITPNQIVVGYPSQLTLSKSQVLTLRVSGEKIAQVAATRLFGGGHDGDALSFALYYPNSTKLCNSDILRLNKKSEQYSVWLEGSASLPPSSAREMWTVVVKANLVSSATVIFYTSKAGHFDVVNGFPFVMDERVGGSGNSRLLLSSAGSALYFRSVLRQSAREKVMASDKVRTIYVDTKPFPSSSAKPAHEGKGIVDYYAPASSTKPTQVWYYSLSSFSRPFTFTVCDETTPIRLLNLNPLISDVGTELYQYFVFKIPDGPMPDVSITVTPFQPDPDLYVARTVFPTKSSYDWDSTQAGKYPERIIVPSDDKKLNMGTWAFTGYFLLGVYRNYKDPSHDTPCPQYSITADFSVPSIRLIDGVQYEQQLDLGDHIYFRRKFDCASQFTFSAHSDKEGCYVQLYAAQGYVPTEKNYDTTTATFERTAILTFPPFAGEFLFLVVGRSPSEDNCSFVISSSQNAFTLGPIGQSKYSYCRTSVAAGKSAICEVLPGWGPPSPNVLVSVNVAVQTGNTSLYVQQGSVPTPTHYTVSDSSFLGNAISLSVKPSEKTYVLVEAAVDSRIAVSLSLNPSMETCLWVDIPQFFAGSTAKALPATTNMFIVAEPLKLLLVNRNASELTVAVSQAGGGGDFSATGSAGWYESTVVTLKGYQAQSRLDFSFTCKPGKDGGGEKCPFSGLLQPLSDPTLILHNELMIVDKSTNIDGQFWFISPDSPSSTLRVFSCNDGPDSVRFDVVDVEGRLTTGIIPSHPSPRSPLHIGELAYPFRADTRYNVTLSSSLRGHVAALHFNAIKRDPFRTHIALQSIHSGDGTRLFIYQSSFFDPSDDVEFLILTRRFSTSITYDDLSSINFEFCAMKTKGQLLGSAVFDSVKETYVYDVPKGYGFGSAFVVVPRSSRFGTSDRLANVPMPLFFRFDEIQTLLMKQGESFHGVVPGFVELCQKNSVLDIWAIQSGEMEVRLGSENGNVWSFNGSSVYSLTLPLEDIMLKSGGCSRLAVNLTATINSKVYFRASLRQSGTPRSYELLPGVPLSISIAAFEEVTLSALLKAGANVLVKVVSLENSVDVALEEDSEGNADWKESVHFATLWTTAPKDGDPVSLRVRGNREGGAVVTIALKDVGQTNEEVLDGSTPSPIELLKPNSVEYYLFTSLGTSSVVSLTLFYPADVTIYASTTVKFPSKASHSWSASFKSTLTASLLIDKLKLFDDVFIAIVAGGGGLSGHVSFSSSVDSLPVTLVDGVPLLFTKESSMRKRAFRVVRETGNAKRMNAVAFRNGRKETLSPLDLKCEFGAAAAAVSSYGPLASMPIPEASRHFELSKCELGLGSSTFDGFDFLVTVASSPYVSILLPHQTSFFHSVESESVDFAVFARRNASVVAYPRAGAVHLSGFGHLATDDSFVLHADGLPPTYQKYVVSVLNGGGQSKNKLKTVDFDISYFSDESQALSLIPDLSELLDLRPGLGMKVPVTSDQHNLLLQIVPTSADSLLREASFEVVDDDDDDIDGKKMEMIPSIAGGRSGRCPANATLLLLLGSGTFTTTMSDLASSQFVAADEHSRPIRLSADQPSVTLRLLLPEDAEKLFFEVDLLVGDVVLFANRNHSIPSSTSFDYRVVIGMDGNGLLIPKVGGSRTWTFVLRSSGGGAVLRYGAFVLEDKIGSGLRSFGRIESEEQTDVFSHKPRGGLTFMHVDEMSSTFPPNSLHPNVLSWQVNNGSQFEVNGLFEWTAPYVFPVEVYKGSEVLFEVKNHVGTSAVDYAIRLLSDDNSQKVFLEDSGRGILLPFPRANFEIYTNSPGATHQKENGSLIYEMCGGYVFRDEEKNRTDCITGKSTTTSTITPSNGRLSDLHIEISPKPEWVSTSFRSPCRLETLFPTAADSAYDISLSSASGPLSSDDHHHDSPFSLVSYVLGDRDARWPVPFKLGEVSREESKWSGVAQSTLTSTFRVDLDYQEQQLHDDDEKAICGVYLWILQCENDPSEDVFDEMESSSSAVMVNYHTPCAIREWTRKAESYDCSLPHGMPYVMKMTSKSDDEIDATTTATASTETIWSVSVPDLEPAPFSVANVIVSHCGKPYRTEYAATPIVFDVDEQTLWFAFFGGLGVVSCCGIGFVLVVFFSFLFCCLRSRLRKGQEHAHSINVNETDFDAGEYMPLNADEDERKEVGDDEALPM